MSKSLVKCPFSSSEPGPGLTSLASVLPLVLEAAQRLSSYSWDILVGDTLCNSTVGPLAAVDMVYKHRPHLFLGKMTSIVNTQSGDNNPFYNQWIEFCQIQFSAKFGSKLCLSVVKLNCIQVQCVPTSFLLCQGEVEANFCILNYELNHLRFSKIWGIPVFTTSGMNSAFRDKSSEYRFLTCLAGDYLQLGAFIKQFLGAKSYFTSGGEFIFGISPDVESLCKILKSTNKIFWK